MFYAKKRFQNRVAESSFLLPSVVLISLFLWLIRDGFAWDNLVGLLFCSVSTLLLMELNNTHVLLRIRSRMVSAVFVVFWGCCAFLHAFQPAHIVLLCMIILYHALFHCYQHYQPVGSVFLAYTALSAACVFLPQLVILVPVLWIALIVYRAFTLRTFFAGLLGLVLPQWLLFSISYLTDNLDVYVHSVIESLEFPPINYGGIDSHQLTAAGIISVVGLVGLMHFMRNSFQDKIRIRMLYYFLIWMQLIYTVGLILLPVHFNTLLLLLIMNSAPLIAHYFALTSHKFTNCLFIVLLFILLFFAIYNLWIPSYNFF